MKTDSRYRVIIVGANFAGLKAAMTLSRKFDVTVIDKNHWFEYLPNIHELVSGIKNPAMLRFSNEAIVRRAGHHYLADTVTQIVPNKNQVITATGKNPHYDFCIVASGGGNNTFGVKDAETYAFPFKNVAQCHRIGLKLQELSQTKAPFFITIVGGGLEGVEALGEILRGYRKHGGLRIRMVERNRSVLNEAPSIIEFEIRRHCNPYPVEFLTQTNLEKVTPNYVMLSKGKKIKSDATLWTGGVRPRVLYEASGFTKTPNQWPPVDEFLRHTEFSNVLFAGDAASLPNAVSKQAYHAMDMGHCAARNISRMVAGKPPESFTPAAKPTLISFGDLDAFMIAGKTVLAGSAISGLKEAVFQKIMTEFDPSPLLMKPFSFSTRVGKAALRLLLSMSLSPEMLTKFGRVRVLK